MISALLWAEYHDNIVLWFPSLKTEAETAAINKVGVKTCPNCIQACHTPPTVTELVSIWSWVINIPPFITLWSFGYKNRVEARACCLRLGQLKLGDGERGLGIGYRQGPWLPQQPIIMACYTWMWPRPEIHSTLHCHPAVLRYVCLCVFTLTE